MVGEQNAHDLLEGESKDNEPVHKVGDERGSLKREELLCTEGNEASEAESE